MSYLVTVCTLQYLSLVCQLPLCPPQLSKNPFCIFSWVFLPAVSSMCITLSQSLFLVYKFVLCPLECKSLLSFRCKTSCSVFHCSSYSCCTFHKCKSVEAYSCTQLTVKKEKKISSYIRKFRRDRVQSHIWLIAPIIWLLFAHLIHILENLQGIGCKVIYD